MTSSKNKNICKTIILYGIILRLIAYLSHRSLWLDETFVYYNIVEHSFAELLGRLDYHQFIPLGYLYLLKTLSLFFGLSENILRLPSFLFGVLSIFAYYSLSKQFFKEKLLILSVALFCFCEPLIYYSTDAKQYCSDVLFTILALHATIRLTNVEMTLKRSLIYGLIGSLCILFSHAATIVIFSCGLCLLFKFILNKDRSNSAKVGLSIMIWETIFILLFIFSYTKTLHSDMTLRYAVSYFGIKPVYPYDRMIQDMLRVTELDPFEIFKYLVPIGFIGVFNKNRFYFSTVFSIYIFTLIASYARFYPNVQRLLLFTIPLLIIIMCSSVEFIIKSLKASKNLKSITLTIITIALISSPFLNTSKRIFSPRNNEEIEVVMDYISKRAKKDDVIFLFPNSSYAFKYYAEKYNLNDQIDKYTDKFKIMPIEKRTFKREGFNTIIIGNFYIHHATNEKDIIGNELSKIVKNRRVWFVVGRTWSSIRPFYLQYFRRHGKIKDRVGVKGLKSTCFNEEYTEGILYEFAPSNNSERRKSRSKRRGLFKKLRGLFN